MTYEFEPRAQTSVDVDVNQGLYQQSAPKLLLDRILHEIAIERKLWNTLFGLAARIIAQFSYCPNLLTLNILDLQQEVYRTWFPQKRRSFLIIEKYSVSIGKVIQYKISTLNILGTGRL